MGVNCAFVELLTDFAKGIKTNPYAPPTGHDDPSAQTRTNSSHQQSTLICRCITDNPDTYYPCPVVSDPFLSVIQEGEIMCDTLICRCITDGHDIHLCLVSSDYFLLVIHR